MGTKYAVKSIDFSKWGVATINPHKLAIEHQLIREQKEEFVHTKLESLCRSINSNVLMMAFGSDSKGRDYVKILFTDGAIKQVEVSGKGLKCITKRVLKAL